ncbi:ABC transporter ATP-binding protein [Cohnella rhizosphaerae]|uniref:ABC transporter ATP-binding protein/permease n=1 Tax=Cohnella rhizosphaerae TaxID=1457232 RepID=A0A9X4QTH6_9BACL|nr:ABC transporter ATP-binding protein [Cohnella rhizosphaerae]MDG0810404.1 ABC transporter ATP-binding protein/permease [Cohnella rhizosphaerae]
MHTELDHDIYDDMVQKHVSWRRIAKLFRPHAWRLFIVMLFIAVAAVGGTIAPFLIRAIVDDALPSRNINLLYLLVLGMGGLAALAASMSMLQVYFTTHVGQSIMHDLRVKLYAHLQSLSLRFYAYARTGDIQSRISNDIGGMQALVTNTIADVAKNVSVVLATILAMFFLDWRLTLLSFVTVPVMIWLNQRIAERRERIMYEQQMKLADMSSMVQETLSISGIILGRTMGRRQHLVNRFTKSSKEVSKLEIRAHTAGQGEWVFIYFGIDILPALTFLVGGGILVNYGSITIGTLVALIALQERLLWPLLELLHTNVEVRKARSLFARVFEYLDTKPDISEVDQPIPVSRSKVRGDVKFENISFTYDGQNKPAISYVDLAIPEGQRIAIVGKTGSGKSTLSYLMTRLYDVDSGRISIDGIDIRNLSFDTLASLIGIVTQDVYVLQGTITENLRFAKPDASHDELVAAAKAAEIHDLITALPLGYQTMLGERGHNFSGGEKQRLAIARVLLRDPPILIFDEATSALDNRTEASIVASIHKIGANRTTIIIAHRLSTVRHCERIVVLENGKILEQGSYSELINQNGAFNKLTHSELLPPRISDLSVGGV